MRKLIAALSSDPISWRSHEPSRLETFSDAVFAFALTLIIVSLEVPKTFKELYEVMKGSFSFAICFVFLFLIWNGQNKFFRHYNLGGGYVTLLNACLLFVVLVYSYPLKFLFYLLFTSQTYIQGGQEVQVIADKDVSKLMCIYGAGFTIVYLLFYLMYRYAMAKAVELKLTPGELFYTRVTTGVYLINVFTGMIAFLLALLLPIGADGSSGWFYLSIPFSITIWKGWMKRRRMPIQMER